MTPEEIASKYSLQEIKEVLDIFRGTYHEKRGDINGNSTEKKSVLSSIS